MGERKGGGVMSRKGERRPSVMLKEMRHVHTRPKEEDVTPGHQKFRKMWEEDFGKFLTLMERWENEHGRKRARAKECLREETRRKEEKEEDRGGEMALELVERLLLEIGERP